MAQQREAVVAIPGNSLRELSETLAAAADARDVELDRTRVELARARDQLEGMRQKLGASEHEARHRNAIIVDLQSQLEARRQEAGDLRGHVGALEASVAQERARRHDEVDRLQNGLKHAQQQTCAAQRSGDEEKARIMRELESLRIELGQQVRARDAQLQTHRRAASAEQGKEVRRHQEELGAHEDLAHRREEKLEAHLLEARRQLTIQREAEAKVEAKFSVISERWRLSEWQNSQLQNSIKQVTRRCDKVAAKEVEELAAARQRVAAVRAEACEAEAMTQRERGMQEAELAVYVGVAEQALRDAKESADQRCLALAEGHTSKLRSEHAEFEIQEVVAAQHAKRVESESVTELNEIRHELEAVEQSMAQLELKYRTEADAVRQNSVRSEEVEASALAAAESASQARLQSARVSAARRKVLLWEGEAEAFRKRLELAEQSHVERVDRQCGDTGGSRDGLVLHPLENLPPRPSVSGSAGYSKDGLVLSQGEDEPLRFEVRRGTYCSGSAGSDAIQKALDAKKGANGDAMAARMTAEEVTRVRCLLRDRDQQLSAVLDEKGALEMALRQAREDVDILSDEIRDLQLQGKTCEMEQVRLRGALGRAEASRDDCFRQKQVADEQLVSAKGECDRLIDITNELRADLNRKKEFSKRPSVEAVVPPCALPLGKAAVVPADAPLEVRPPQESAWFSAPELKNFGQTTCRSSVRPAFNTAPDAPVLAVAASDRATSSQTRALDALRRAQQRHANPP